MLRQRLGVSFIFILLTVGIFSGLPTISNTSSASIETQSIANHSVLSNELPTIAWTSRSQLEPLALQNNSVVAGDHIMLNATFPQEMNVTRCEMRVWSGFTYITTRPQVIPTDPGGVFDGIIDPAQFDWVVIKGIEKGLTINVTCSFTSNDTDFMAWDGSLDQSEYTYANNILDMASADNPEHDSFIWTSDSDTMVLGCLDYTQEVGNWTLFFQAGFDEIKSSNTSTIEMDTYYLSGSNQTCSVSVVGYTNLDQSILMTRENVRICNFFLPEVIVPTPVCLEIDVYTFNITWSCTDANADDVNYYSVWLSNNDGVSYMLLAQNRTRTWFLWNSSGWLEDEYMVKVQAFSLDFTIGELMDTSNPPDGYWPGDFNEGFSGLFHAGDVGIGHPTPDPFYSTLEMSIANTNYEYSLGSTGNTIVVSVQIQYYLPSSITYYVNDNGSSWIQDEYIPQSFTDSFSINIDGLALGYHTLQIVMYDSIYSHFKTCYVNVTNSISRFTTGDALIPSLFIQSVALGISVGSICIIGFVIVLSIRLKRSKTVEVLSSSELIWERQKQGWKVIKGAEN